MLQSFLGSSQKQVQLSKAVAVSEKFAGVYPVKVKEARYE
jgi:hypothetical protein